MVIIVDTIAFLDINDKLLKIQIKTAHKVSSTKFSIPFCK